MGKRQHQKDKLYLTCTEWTQIYGGRRPEQDLEQELIAKFRRIPFDICCLSLQPFEHPYCNSSGYIFDLSNIVPFLKKHSLDPISGEPLEAKSLVKLNFFKSQEGDYHCPILYKKFSENTHIVANRKSGNVFCYEAVEQLNFKAKNFRDLLTDEPFTKKDIISLQEPGNIEKVTASKFFHVKNSLKWLDEELEISGPSKRLKNVSNVTQSILSELAESTSSQSVDEKQKDTKGDKPDKFNMASYSTGRAAAATTSTVMDIEYRVEAATLDDDVVRHSRVKGKAYVQLQTTCGNLNFELYCSDTPKACDNFLRLCKKHYYENTIFHRSIKNFMIQGGDPTGTGKGGDSIWEKTFPDEFKSYLVHQGRGMLCMANSGPDTNKSQFFITFRSCRHLDRKHTVFGKVVGGLETLDKMEKRETDKDDRPLTDIKILNAVIFVDPFQEVEDMIAKERAEIKEEKLQLEKSKDRREPKPSVKSFRSGVGSFVDLDRVQLAREDKSMESAELEKKKKGARSTFGDFNDW